MTPTHPTTPSPATMSAGSIPDRSASAMPADPTPDLSASAMTAGLTPAPGAMSAAHANAHAPSGDAIAIVGMACRYPDADDPDQLWQLVLDQRQAFRELPPERLDLADYYHPDRTKPDKIYSSRAALIEGWTFDRAAFRIPGPAYRATDPAHWLALETAARALADAGFPGGQGLDGDRVGVVIGNSLTGEVTRAATLRLRWPYVRRTLAAAAADAGLDTAQIDALLANAKTRYLRPFAPVGDETLAGSLANTIAGRVCNHFDFHGGGYTVDGACASSLLAVVNACQSLADGSVDVALAGGVDISIDPFELVGFAKAGALAPETMRVYDERAAGFLPGEGCGVVVLMRAADARAVGLPAYAEIAGWGVASDGSGGITRPDQQGQLRALRRAYARAGMDPAAVGLFEGHGTGTAVGDAVELGALTALRRHATSPAALGSIKANIGHTKAASGLAGLLKATLSIASATLPPTTGCDRPHPLLRAPDAVLRVLAQPRPWPAGPRLAGVSSFGFGGINAHLALTEPAPAASRVLAPAHYQCRRPAPRTDLIALAGDDLAELRAQLHRLAALAPRVSDAELHDLAAQFAAAKPDGKHRVALVAATPRQLAERAARAADRLTESRPGTLTSLDGSYFGTAVAGRVTLLLPGQGAPVRATLGALGHALAESADPHTGLGGAAGTALAQPVIYRTTLAALRWLDQLGVTAQAAVGHSLGEIAGLVWAGCLSTADGDRLVRRRGELMETLGRRGTTMLSLATDPATARDLCAGTELVIAADNGPRSQVLAGPDADIQVAARRAADRGVPAVALPVSHAFHSPAMADCVPEFAAHLRGVSFRPPTARLISTVSGQLIDSPDELADALADQLTAPVRFWPAIERALPDTDLFCEIGPGHTLSALIAAGCSTPVVAVEAGSDDDAPLADTLAALFAAGAIPDLAAIFADRAARPIDLWRDPTFLANPCATAPTTPSTTPDDPPTAPIPVIVEGDVGSVVRALLAEATELDPALINADARLLRDLHLTSLRVAQLVVTAATATGRARPVAPLLLADATVTELVDTITALPPSDTTTDPAPPTGLAFWIACFAEDHQRTITRPPTVRPETWRPHITPNHPLTDSARALFPPGTNTTNPLDVIYLPDPAAPTAIPTLLTATHTALGTTAPAIGSGALVVITHGSGLSGFLRALRQEYPALGVTLLRVPATVDGLHLAARHIAAEPGTWREFVLSADGVLDRVAATRIDAPAEGPLPLGARDVVLVSGGGKGLGHVCAAALARESGASLALLGRSTPDTDDILRTNLNTLRDNGIRAAYVSADVTDPAATQRGIDELTSQLGPITAVLHASGVNHPARLADLDETSFTTHLAPKVTGLHNLLAALDPGRLRLLVTFGSIIGRYGLAGECHYALANGALRAEAERLAEALPDCRVLNLDWSVWAGAGMGEQLGVVDSLLRLDVTPIPVAEGTELFLSLLRGTHLPTTVAVHGRIGGLLSADGPTPSGRFLERVLVGYPGVELVVEADLDADRDAYLRDHRIDGLAVLPAVVGLEAMAEAATAVAGRTLLRAVDVRFDRPIVLDPDGRRTIRICALRRGDEVEVAVRSAETDHCVDHFRATFPLVQPGEPITRPDPPDEPVPLGPADLYGPLYFHTGAFRLVDGFSALGARYVHARLRAPDDEVLHPLVGAAPLLGEITSNDATVHALQACVPRRRLLPVGCERFTRVAGTSPPREIFATERSAANGEYVWDVLALDRFGKRTLRWVGLRLRDVGPLHHDNPLPAPLLAIDLERASTALGLDPTLRVHIREGERTTPSTGDAAGHTSRSYCDGLVLTVSADHGVACDWEPLADRPAEQWRELIGAPRAPLLDRLRAMLAEPTTTVAARLWTVLECLSKAGCPPTTPLVVDGVYDGGWAVLRAGAARIASTVTPVGDAGRPVAIAVLTRQPDKDHRAEDV